HLPADTDLVEQRALRKREVLFPAFPDGVANEQPECQRIGVPVAAERVRLELQRSRRRERECVDGTRVAEVVIVVAWNVFRATAAEAKSARHVHEVDDTDLRAR